MVSLRLDEIQIILHALETVVWLYWWEYNLILSSSYSFWYYGMCGGSGACRTWPRPFGELTLKGNYHYEFKGSFRGARLRLFLVI